ncbi:zonular occludens toxin domain-containing protein [Pseudoxanthomonas sp.]|uniref:zonular occludens toxin domain-containing protein n=1 Tax=Pseudoxanthomonas sp. TaxID=1871049 RepID=UPI002582FAC0|nr:zonular occludens toxin domain-containing protein [Pseudoxanthomonas sp.]MCR6687084.1 zonular occludens toxin domain-containing protein [Pseudoxanthomonas sp.]
MPIEILTGQPGNGKTALMMERLLSEAAKGERPIFAAGIDGLQPGLAAVLDDPRDWNKRDPVTGEYVVPHGSLIFVDEAWKWFGHLHDASRQATPKHVLDLAEHRHRGLDFVWTTQQPNQLYPFVRGLVGSHHHVVRRFGTKMIDVFSWGELNEEIKSAAKRELAQRRTRFLPKEAFGSYKSAEVHTIKARVPLKVLAIPGLLVAAAVLGWWAFNTLRPDAYAASLTGKEAANAAQAASPPASVPVGQVDRAQPVYATLTDYAKAHLPRFATMPWTAPIFDSRAVTADPQLYCMSSLAGEVADGSHRDLSCSCFTEQGTRYEVSQAECRTVARYGVPYNPYRERREEQPSAAAPMAFSGPQQPASAMHAIPGQPAKVNGAGTVL